MSMTAIWKAGAGAVVAVGIWLDVNFGTAIYILAGFLVIDALLNYKNEEAYLKKLAYYAVSAASTFYLQNASLSGIPMARGIIVILATHEVYQVFSQVALKLNIIKTQAGAPDLAGVEALLAGTEQRILATLGSASGSLPVPKQELPPAEPSPQDVSSVNFGTGPNGE